MKESNPIPNEHRQLVFPPILDLTFRIREKKTRLEAILNEWWHRINKQKRPSSTLFVAVFDNWISTPCSWLWVKIVQVMFDGPFSQLESIAILHVALSKVIRLGRPAVPWVLRSSTHHLLVGGWTNPFEKYSSNWTPSPIFGVKIKNISNHHLVFQDLKKNCKQTK